MPSVRSWSNVAIVDNTLQWDTLRKQCDFFADQMCSNCVWLSCRKSNCCFLKVKSWTLFEADLFLTLQEMPHECGTQTEDTASAPDSQNRPPDSQNRPLTFIFCFAIEHYHKIVHKFKSFCVANKCWHCWQQKKNLHSESFSKWEQTDNIIEWCVRILAIFLFNCSNMKHIFWKHILLFVVSVCTQFLCLFQNCF